MPRPRAAETGVSASGNLNLPGTPGSPHLSSSSGTTGGEATGQQKPHHNVCVRQTAPAQGKTGFSNVSRSNLESWGWRSCARGVSQPPALPEQPQPRAVCAGVPAKPVGSTYRPALRGMLSSWPRPAAAPPRWVSRGQQALGGVTQGG